MEDFDVYNTILLSLMTANMQNYLCVKLAHVDKIINHFFNQ